MIRKDELLAAMLRECRICVHLHGTIPSDGFDFRFTPPQRSTVELLRYISFVGLGASRGLVEGEWDAYQALEAEAESLDPVDFTSPTPRSSHTECSCSCMPRPPATRRSGRPTAGRG